MEEEKKSERNIVYKWKDHPKQFHKVVKGKLTIKNQRARLRSAEGEVIKVRIYVKSLNTKFRSVYTFEDL